MKLVRLSAFALLAMLCGALHAQYPSKTVTIVVPFSAGSDADLSLDRNGFHDAHGGRRRHDPLETEARLAQ